MIQILFATYILQMYHVGTNEEYSPDFDSQLLCEPAPGVGIILNDPDGLIVESDDTSRSS